MTASHDTLSLQSYSRPVRPGLLLEPLEPTGQAISDEETDAIIRQILTENIPPRSGRRALPALAPQEEFAEVRREPTPRQVRADIETEVDARAAPDPILYPEESKPRLPRTRLLRRASWIAGLGLFVYLWPWAIPLAVFVAIWVSVIICATVGSDWIGRWTLRFYLWLDARNHARAERLRARADNVALRLDRLLDRLPERWTAGLYLPDFSRAALVPEPEQDRPDPFDRIAVEARGI